MTEGAARGLLLQNLEWERFSACRKYPDNASEIHGGCSTLACESRSIVPNASMRELPSIYNACRYGSGSEWRVGRGILSSILGDPKLDETGVGRVVENAARRWSQAATGPGRHGRRVRPVAVLPAEPPLGRGRGGRDGLAPGHGGRPAALGHALDHGASAQLGALGALERHRLVDAVEVAHPR